MDTISIPTTQSQTTLNASTGTCVQAETPTYANKPVNLPTQSGLRVLRIKDVAEKLAIGKSTIYDWLDVKSPRYDASFPKPIKLSAKSIGWLSSEVDTWLLVKVEQTRGKSLIS